MISSIVLYLIILICVFVFSLYYYAWFSWILLLITICAPFLSLIISLPSMIRLVKSGMAISAESESVQGERLYLSISAKTDKRLFCPFLKIKLKAENRFARKKEKITFKFSGTLDGSRTLKSKKLAAHCGRLEINIKKCRIYDMSGIFFIPARHNRSCEINIMPKPEKPKLMPNFEDTPILGYKSAPSGTFSDYYELRQYQSGDSLKSIHWKLSSRQDELIIREPNLPVYKQILVKAELCDKPLINNGILARFAFVCDFLIKGSVRFFAEDGFGGAVLIKSREDVSLLIEAIYNNASIGGAEIDRSNMIFYTINADGEEMSDT